MSIERNLWILCDTLRCSRDDDEKPDAEIYVYAYGRTSIVKNVNVYEVAQGTTAIY